MIRHSIQEYAQSGLHHITLRSIEAIQRECIDWNRCVDLAYDANPFLSLDWHLLWLQHFADESVQICYTVVRDAGTAIAFFPVIVRKEKFHGLYLKTLSFSENLYSPIACPIIDEPVRVRCLQYFVERVLPEMEWQLFRAPRLPEDYFSVPEMVGALNQVGYRAWLEKGEGNWIWNNPTVESVDSASYFAGLKFNIRSDVRRFSKKLSEIGRLELCVVSENLTDSHVDDYRSVYVQSWKPAELDASFHPALIRLAAQRGWLRLGFLRINGEPIATQLWLFRQNRGYVVKTAYVEEWSRFSPGTLLTWRMVEHLMNEDGMKCFDFLRGDDTYKKYWTNQRRVRKSMVVLRRDVVGTLLWFLDQRVLPMARRTPWLNWLKERAVRVLR